MGVFSRWPRQHRPVQLQPGKAKPGDFGGSVYSAAWANFLVLQPVLDTFQLQDGKVARMQKVWASMTKRLQRLREAKSKSKKLHTSFEHLFILRFLSFAKFSALQPARLQARSIRGRRLKAKKREALTLKNTSTCAFLGPAAALVQKVQGVIHLFLGFR